MSSMGFMSRVANWWRGRNEIDTPPWDVPEATESEAPTATATLERTERVPLVDPRLEDGPQVTPDRPDPAARQQAALRDITQRFTRATDALEEIRTGLSGLEGTFEELPETVRAQTRFLGAINERLEAQELHSRELLMTLRTLPEVGQEQARAMRQANELLRRNHEALRPLAGSFHHLAKSVNELRESSARHLVCLNTLTERHERYLAEQRDAFRRQHRVTVGLLVMTALAAAGGLAVGLIVLAG